MTEATITVIGTFTKTVADGTGTVDITLPSVSDEVMLMYGTLVAGAVKAGADDGSVSIRDALAGLGNVMMALAGYAAIAAGQNCRFPQIGTTPANNCLSDKPSRECLRLTGTDAMCFVLGTMAHATSETFLVSARFRSKTGKALLVTATGGTWT